jgi:signal transduction histidine kinase
MGAAARTGTLQLVNDVTSDPRHIPTPGATGITAELAVPIRLGGRVLGVVNVESSQPFDEEDAASLEIVADHLAVAIENVRLYDRGQHLAVLEERQRLARELHDSVTQHIFGMNLIAQSLGSAWRRDEVEAERRVARMVELSQTALAEMRALLTELRPMAERWVAASEPAHTGIALVRKSGLVAALDRHIADLALDGSAVDLDISCYRAQPVDTEMELFRIVQEALNNVVKHARAKRVGVQLCAGSTELLVVVLDDGCGFAPPVPGSGTKSGGIGLSTMRERALHLGGTLEVQSTPGAGTRVAARLPLHVLVPV